MRSMYRTGVCIVVAAVLVSAAGCAPPVDTRTTNQGGSNLVSLGIKLANNDVGGMNPDDWQVLTDNLPQFATMLGIDLSGINLLPMSDEEAAALEAFLASNGVATIEDLQALGNAIGAGQVTVPIELVNWASPLADMFI